MLNIKSVKRNFGFILLFLSTTVFAAENISDTFCYRDCPMTPSGKEPAAFFNHPEFLEKHNCLALQGLCQWVKKTSPLAVKPVVVADYDGTQVAENISVHARESYISDRFRSENSLVFGVIAPKLQSLGYSLGMALTGFSSSQAAQYLAARDDNCETTTFSSSQVKYDYCMSGRMVGMSAETLRALHRIMLKVFPSLNDYFTSSKAMLNYLVDMGYPLWTQTGGTPYPALTKASQHPLLFNQIFRTKPCDFVRQSSSFMNKVCPIIYNGPHIDSGRVTMVMNTENVCEGISYANAQQAGKQNLCIDDAVGKVSGLTSIEQRTQNVVLNFHGNSSHDIEAAMKVLKQGGIVFMHNNLSACETMNKVFPGACFDIIDDEHETRFSLVSPDDDVYVRAAREEALL